MSLIRFHTSAIIQVMIESSQKLDSEYHKDIIHKWFFLIKINN